MDEVFFDIRNNQGRGIKVLSAEAEGHSYFAVRELDIAVRGLDIALGNHALRAQPTDYLQISE